MKLLSRRSRQLTLADIGRKILNTYWGKKWNLKLYSVLGLFFSYFARDLRLVQEIRMDGLI